MIRSWYCFSIQAQMICFWDSAAPHAQPSTRAQQMLGPCTHLHSCYDGRHKVPWLQLQISNHLESASFPWRPRHRFSYALLRQTVIQTGSKEPWTSLSPENLLQEEDPWVVKLQDNIGPVVNIRAFDTSLPLHRHLTHSWSDYRVHHALG